MQVTRTIEARHAQSGMRLTGVEGASMRVGTDGLAIEMAHTRQIDGGDEHMLEVVLEVWHDTWMFAVCVEPEAHVGVAFDGDRFDPPGAPSRAGKIRVHGTWHDGGDATPAHVAWAPEGYPMVTPEQD